MFQKLERDFLEKWGKRLILQSTVFRDASGIKSSKGYEANRKCRDFNFLHYFNKRSLPISMWTYILDLGIYNLRKEGGSCWKISYLNVRSTISSDGHREDVAIYDVIMDADISSIFDKCSMLL